MPDERTEHKQLNFAGVRPHSKAEGAFVAAAAADALGWPQEIRGKTVSPLPATAKLDFSSWVRWDGGRFYRHEQGINAGEYSDDTQLMLAVARCRPLSDPGWWTAFTRTELPLWILYERGGGTATKRAARSWLRGIPPWADDESDSAARFFNAGGNGVAMRVLPHAIYFASSDEPSLLIQDIFLDGIATHGHPRAIVGAAAYGFAAWWYLRSQETISFGEIIQVLLGEVDRWSAMPEPLASPTGWPEAVRKAFGGNYRHLWSEVVTEMVLLLENVQNGLSVGAISNDEEILRELGAYGHMKGAGTITAASALYLAARYAAQPTQGVLRAAFGLGTDTDTIGAMVGGLAGCSSGGDWIPQEWLRVQDIDYIQQLANLLAQGPNRESNQLTKPIVVGHSQLESIRRALVSEEKTDLLLDGCRYAKVIEVSQPRPSSKSSKVRTWSLRIEDGQTIYVTIHSPEPMPTEQASSKSATTEPQGTKPLPRVSGAVLGVRDVAKAVSFYSTVFGFSPTSVSDSLATFEDLCLFSVDPAEELSPSRIQGGTGNRDMLIRISVPFLDGVFDLVATNGGTITQHPVTTENQQRTFFCLDIDGHPIQVLEDQQT